MYQAVIETNPTQAARTKKTKNKPKNTPDSENSASVRGQESKFPPPHPPARACVCVGRRMKMDLIVCYCDLIEWFVAQLSTGGAPRE